MRDKLSRREDRALLKAMRAVVLTQFPNPDRKNCPGTPVLHAIATKRISMLDSAHSRRFKELTEMRRALQRRKILRSAMGTTGAALVIVPVCVTYFGSYGVDSPFGPQTVQRERPRESSSAVNRRNVGETEAPAPTYRAPLQPNCEIVLLDLRNASAAITVEPWRPIQTCLSLSWPRLFGVYRPTPCLVEGNRMYRYRTLSSLPPNPGRSACWNWRRCERNS